MKDHIALLIERKPELAVCRADIERATDLLYNCYLNRGTILICGNGGSASDAEHISGELLKGFLMRRTPDDATIEKIGDALGSREMAAKLQGGIPAIPLISLTSVLSAFANDVDPELVFGQLVYAFARENDAFIGLSTSGNSKNVVAAAQIAKAIGIPAIAMTGESGGKLRDVCDVTIKVPARETYQVQEYHLPVYHAICAELEERIFGTK